MIDYIRGNVTELTPTVAILEAAGVGYAVNIALPTYSYLQDKQSADKGGGDIKLYTSEIIREDTHELYGFPTKGERQLFDMLMTVSGVGANTARMILSAYTASEIRQVIATGNAHALGQVKGIGPKSAQRIIVDLKDKVMKISLDDSVGGTDDVAGGTLFPQLDSEVKTEAVSALTMLGFAPAASSKVVDKILKEVPQATIEQVIKQALKML